MFNSQILDIVIGVVFVWFLLSLAVSAVIQGFSWFTKVRSKMLWHSLAGLFDENIKAPDSRLRTLFFRIPFGRDDVRPVSTAEEGVSAKLPKRVSQRETAKPPDPPAGLQGLYEVLRERIPDPASGSYRSRISSLPRKAVSDALLRLAESTVTKASLLAVLPPEPTVPASPPDQAAALRTFVSGLPAGVLTLDQAGTTVSGTGPDGTAISTSVPTDLTTAFRATWDEARKLVTVEDLEALVTGDGALARALGRIREAASPMEQKVQEAREEIERWFDTSMQALTRFYQRQNRKLAAIVAVPLVLFTTADSLDLYQRLRNDQDLAAATSSQAASWVAQPLERSGGTIDVDKLCKRLDEEADSTGTSTTTTTAAPDASAAGTGSHAGGAGDDAAPAPPAGGAESAPTTTISVEQAVGEARLRLECARDLVASTDLLKIIWPTGLWQEIRDQGGAGGCAVCDVFRWIPDGFIGRLVTWLALLFGASFWYDVLRRLTGIRQGGKPTTATNADG